MLVVPTTSAHWSMYRCSCHCPTAAVGTWRSHSPVPWAPVPHWWPSGAGIGDLALRVHTGMCKCTVGLEMACLGETPSLCPMGYSPAANTWHCNQTLGMVQWPLHDWSQSLPFTLLPPICPRPFDISGQGYNNWIFMSTHFWDEDPRGLWTLGLENKGYYFNTGERWAQAGGSVAGFSYPSAEGLPVVFLKRL